MKKYKSKEIISYVPTVDTDIRVGLKTTLTILGGTAVLVLAILTIIGVGWIAE